MEQRTKLTFLLPCLLALPSVPLLWHVESPPESTASPQRVVGTTVSAPPVESDSLVLPDGTPLRLKVAMGFSSNGTKVGDVIVFSVAFEVRVDGVVVIPQRTILTAKVVSVTRPGRGMRDGEVRVAYDALTLPTGETATVRAFLKTKTTSEGGKIAKGAADATGTAVGVVLTAGVGLVAAAVTKGQEEVISTGALSVVYLDGPLSIDRKAAIALQPAPDSGYGFVHVRGSVVVQRRHNLSKLYCGELLINSTYGGLQLELPQGTYWFSTDSQKDRPARIDVLANHEYVISRNGHGLLAKEFQLKKGTVYPVWSSDLDMTGLTPERYKALTAEPANKGND